MAATTTRPADRAGIVRRGFRVLGMGIRLQPRSFAVAVGGAALYGAMTVASAVVLGRVTDGVIVAAFAAGEVPRAALAAGSAAIVGVAVAKALGIILRRTGATYMQARLEALFRRRVTEQYQRLPLAWHQRRSTGSLLSNANADVESMWWPIAPLPFALGVLVMLAITGAALVTTDLALTGVALLVGPALGVLNWRYNRRIKGPATRAQQLRADVSGVAHESFDAALVVKTLGRERAETARFRRESERLRDELVQMGRIRALYEPLLDALPHAGVLLIVVVGSWRVATGALSAGELVTFAYLFTLLAFPLRLFGFLLSELPRAVVGWDRVRTVLDADEALPDGEGGIDGDHPARVDVLSLAFTYPAQGRAPAGRGLRDVTFSAAPGRTIALVGATGAGKSTVANLLVRLADPDAGTVAIDRRDVRGVARAALAQHVGVVFQQSFLFDASVRDNVTLGEPYDDDAVAAALRLAQAWDFVSALPEGLDTVVGERGTSLSGGQRQRLALARALVRRPRLLILDDATSSVDAAVEAAILRGLQEAALPSTVVVIAYRRATIALADEIVFIADGAVRARGSHEHLLAAEPAYARLVSAHDSRAEP